MISDTAEQENVYIPKKAIINHRTPGTKNFSSFRLSRPNLHIIVKCHARLDDTRVGLDADYMNSFDLISALATPSGLGATYQILTASFKLKSVNSHQAGLYPVSKNA